MATPAQLAKVRRLLNQLSIATNKAKLGDIVVTFGAPASPTAAGAVKQAAAVTNANVDNSDAGVKINEVIASLKSAGIMA